LYPHKTGAPNAFIQRFKASHEKLFREIDKAHWMNCQSALLPPLETALAPQNRAHGSNQS
jgi:hypothetical protein